MSGCSSCGSKDTCSKDKEKCMIEEGNPLNNIKNIVAVMSGKGGVGKSTVSVLMAKKLKALGYKVGVLDADITGPSVPRLFGLKGEKAQSNESVIFPVETDEQIKVMSLNLLVPDENQPVIWRGPLIAGMVKQFWTDVLWEELDYLIIDMPPGTGDVPLTVMQSLPISGVVMVSVPQDMVSMIVSKAVNMARQMDIDVLGIVENMSYITCEDCGKKMSLFDNENMQQFLDEMSLELLGELPMQKSVSRLASNGGQALDEEVSQIFDQITEKVINKLKNK